MRQSNPKKSVRKRVVNVRLLIATLVAIAVFAPAAYFWHKHRLAQTSDVLLARAEKLEEDKKWGRASNYYQRYLLLDPDNTDVLVRLVEAYSKGPKEFQRTLRLNKLLYQTLGRVSERDDLQLMLAENLLLIGNYAKAEEEAKKVQASAEEASEAKKVIALSQYYRARDKGKITIVDALRKLKETGDALPADIQLAELTAGMLRKHAKMMRARAEYAALKEEKSTPQGESSEYQDRNADFQIENPDVEADLIIDRMVKANDESVDARVARYRYRWPNQVPDMSNDLETALELDPEHLEALLLASQKAMAKDNDLQQAEKLLRRANQVEPEDGRIYLALGTLFKKQGNEDGAIEILREGSKVAQSQKFDIDITLVDLLLVAQEHDKAEKILTQLERDSVLRIARLKPEEKVVVENQIRLLHARLDLARQRIQPAFTALRAIITSTKAVDAKSVSAQALQARILLARHLGAQRRWDMAFPHWDVLAEALSDRGVIVLAAAECSLKAGNPKACIDYLERFLREPEITTKEFLPNVYVRLVQAHLEDQLRRPNYQRNWSDFLSVLRKAKQQAPERWEVPMAEVTYLTNSEKTPSDSKTTLPEGDRPSSNHQAQAAQLLEGLETQLPQDSEVWQRIALAYARLEMPSGAQRALAHYRTIEKSVAKVVELEATLLSAEQKYTEAERVLSDALPKLRGKEKLQVELTRVKVLVNSGKVESAQEAVGRLIQSSQVNPLVLMVGIEICLKTEDYQAAEEWGKLLQKDPLYAFEWRYLRTRRLLANYAKLEEQQRQSLPELLESLRTEKPQWHAIPALAAAYNEMQEDVEQAIQSYKLAVKLGDRSDRTLERLISLLTEQGKLSEAQDYLSRLTAERPENTRLELAQISLTVRQEKISEAVELARQALKKNTQDPMKYVVLANLLLRDDQAKSAEEIIRQATEQFPQDQRVWNALFGMLIETGQPEQAREALASLMGSLKVSSARRAFILAQAHERLGDWQESKAHYERAIEEEPTDVAMRLNYARLLLRSNVVAAREQYETVLDLEDGSNDEARRSLAQLLVDTGKEDDAARAIELLQNNSAQDQMLDNRLQAFLWTKIGNTREAREANYKKAERILRQEVENSKGQDRLASVLLLARVYQQHALLSNDDSILEASREQFRKLVNRASPPIDHIKFYLEFLLRHAKPEASFAPQYLSEAELRLEQLKKAQASKEIDSNNKETDSSNLENLRFEIRLLQLAERLEEAKEVLNDYAQQRETEIAPGEEGKKKRGQLFAVIGSLFTALQEHEQAEQWYLRLTEIFPEMYSMLASCLAAQDRIEDAVDVCLRAAKESDSTTRPIVVLIQLLSSAERNLPNQTELESLIASTLEANDQDVDLLMAMAVWKVGQQKNDEAVTLFRQVIKVNPENTIALNNLATLLAESSEQLQEALLHIEKAIAIDGRTQPLLDTQGTIFLKLKEPDKAIACLEEATVGGALDPRYYFHLAAAYESADQQEKARTNFMLAQDYGLGRALLTEDDRQILSRLESKIGSETEVNQ